MDEEEIHVVDSQTAERFIQSGNGAIVALEFAVQFCRDEELLPGEAAISNALANASFVVISVGGVNMPVSGFDRGEDEWSNGFIIVRRGAQTELRDGLTVVKRE